MSLSGSLEACARNREGAGLDLCCPRQQLPGSGSIDTERYRIGIYFRHQEAFYVIQVTSGCWACWRGGRKARQSREPTTRDWRVRRERCEPWCTSPELAPAMRRRGIHDREGFSSLPRLKMLRDHGRGGFSERISMIVKDLVRQGVLNPSGSWTDEAPRQRRSDRSGSWGWCDRPAVWGVKVASWGLVGPWVTGRRRLGGGCGFPGR